MSLSTHKFQSVLRQMTNTSEQSVSSDKSAGESKSKEPKQGSVYEINPELLKKIKESLTIPIPDRDESWQIEGLTNPLKSEKKILGIFKKKSLSPEELKDLRKSALQSPGNTRTKIHKLKKQYPDNSVLFMLSAVCTHGMLMNSSNQREVLRGLKIATKEAATALLSNGISVYNCDNFFKIYFSYIDRHKRFQIKPSIPLKSIPGWTTTRAN